MSLGPKLEAFKAYAEKLDLKVSVTEHDRGAYLVIQDPSVTRGWLQIIRTESSTGGRASHGAYYTWTQSGKGKKTSLRSCYGILQQFAGH
jgi:hypothetical protein